jgi:hypothetical protein
VHLVGLSLTAVNDGDRWSQRVLCTRKTLLDAAVLMYLHILLAESNERLRSSLLAPSPIFLSVPGGRITSQIEMETSCVHLPTELWLQILQLAAKHPTKDEFADQAGSYEWFPCDSSTIFMLMERREESMLLKTRLTLAFVCKTWRPIGIELLWSHVRIILNKSSNTLEDILDILQAKPYLGKLVKRLCIRAQTAPYNGRRERHNSNYSKICNLLNYLPPAPYAIPKGLTRPAVARVYRATCKTLPATSVNRSENHGHVLHAWYHIRMLSIDPPNIWFPYGSIMSFLHLETLYITLRTSDSAICVARMWSMPSLRFLSILGRDELDCSLLLRSTSATLEYLQLNMRICQSNLWPNRTELPKLTSLYISLVHGSNSGNSAITALGLIKAPDLRRLGIYEITLGNTPSSELVKHINAAIKVYPSLEEISLEGRMELICTHGGIAIPNIESWCEKGIQVKVRIGVGAWTTYTRQ